jgi:type III secretory pathway component EscV
MTMSESNNSSNDSLGKWIAIHVVGSIIAVLGALYLLAGMNLIPGVPGSSFQALLMLVGGLILDFWGVIGLTKVMRARKAAKASKA